MFPSWLSSPSSTADVSDGRHAVLGTPLKAPLMTDQEEAIFACGCFWGAEKGFWRLPGVVSTAVGYAGGQVDKPSYQQVCSGRTGHTEGVRVIWSTPAIDFSDLLKLFWECHDPTQGDRQGNDTGSQYRSAIYTTTERQMAMLWPAATLIRNGWAPAAMEPSQRRSKPTRPSISPSPTTSSTWRNRAAVPIAQQCRRKSRSRTSTALTIDCPQRSGTTTTGASTTACCGATTRRSR